MLIITLVSGGFKSSVTSEISKQFFKVRLWSSRYYTGDLCNYEKLSDEIKAEIPLKRVDEPGRAGRLRYQYYRVIQ